MHQILSQDDPINLIYEGFTKRWEEATSWKSDTNCISTSLFLTQIQRDQVQKWVSKESLRIKSLKSMESVVPGTVLCWEYHPGFRKSGRFKRNPEIWHMAIVKEVSPKVRVFHRPGLNLQASIDSVQDADLCNHEHLQPEGYCDIVLFSYSTGKLRKFMKRDSSRIWPNIPIAELRKDLELKRVEFFKL